MSSSHRLASLDILRGFTLFLLVFLHPVAYDVLTLINKPQAQSILYHLNHEVWEGFRFWDLVMPLFLFMSGTSMPFSFNKMLREENKGAIYRKVVRRFFLLFLLGMVVQGNLLGLNPGTVYIYTNTLQAIAVGYLVTSLIWLNTSTRGRYAALGILLLAYSIPMMWYGDYSPEGNLACRLDAVVLRRFRGDPTYAWLLPSFTFSATVLMGALSGDLIWQRRTSEERHRVSVRLFWSGILFCVLGWVWGFEMPIIKRIWTASMALYSGGLCMLLLSVFYEVIDVRGLHHGLDWLKIYGMNSIVAYMLGEVINFRSVIHSVSYGLSPRLGDYYSAWLTFGNYTLVFLILWYLHRARIYIKV